jgi:hypothetical protein
MFYPEGQEWKDTNDSKKIGLLYIFLFHEYTNKKENQIFLIYMEIRNGAVAKSYMINGLIYD